MFSVNSFCTVPWSSIVVMPSGDFRICCFGGTKKDNGIGLDEHGQVMNVLTHSFKEAMNTDLHKSVRLAQSRNEKHPSCYVCWKKEKAHLTEKNTHIYTVDTPGAYSYRIGRTFKHGKDAVSLNDAPSMMAADGSIDNMPISLDLRFTNLCNAKCIQCGPKYSSLWYNDHAELTGKYDFDVGSKNYKIIKDNNKLIDNMVPWHDSPIWWERFDEIKNDVRHIYLTGGEPFIQKSHSKLLDIINEANLAHNIRLSYDTNLTVINKQLLDKLSKFKEVRFGISVDDTEKRYELIRYPCSWKKLNENLLTVMQVPNISITITNCIGIFNYDAPMRIIPHFNKLGINKFSFRLLSHPSCYDLANLTPNVKNEIIEMYENSNVPIQHKSLIVGYLKNTMHKYTLDECDTHAQDYIKRMNKLDQLRGTDWVDVFPGVLEKVTKK